MFVRDSEIRRKGDVIYFIEFDVKQKEICLNIGNKEFYFFDTRLVELNLPICLILEKITISYLGYPNKSITDIEIHSGYAGIKDTFNLCGNMYKIVDSKMVKQ